MRSFRPTRLHHIGPLFVMMHASVHQHPSLAICLEVGYTNSPCVVSGLSFRIWHIVLLYLLSLGGVLPPPPLQKGGSSQITSG